MYIILNRNSTRKYRLCSAVGSIYLWTTLAGKDVLGELVFFFFPHHLLWVSSWFNIGLLFTDSIWWEKGKVSSFSPFSFLLGLEDPCPLKLVWNVSSEDFQQWRNLISPVTFHGTVGTRLSEREMRIDLTCGHDWPTGSSSSVSVRV